MGEHDGNHSFCDHFKVNLARLLYEMVGTCLFTMIMLTTGAQTGRILLSLWILTVFCWKISGSHFNPAISVAYIFRKDTSGLPRAVCFFYCLAQCLGAFGGAVMMQWLQTAVLPIRPLNLSVAEVDVNNTFRCILQEILGTFVYVFFFMS